jgi:hypothetical protein
MNNRNAFPLLGTLATSAISVLALAVSLALNHPELLDVLATDGGALLTRCVGLAFPT